MREREQAQRELQEAHDTLEQKVTERSAQLQVEMTARKTAEVQFKAVLAERNQMLAFEPPHFGAGATVGGMVAAGLSGPARASVGSARDYVLGLNLVNGRGEELVGVEARQIARIEPRLDVPGA